MKLPDELLNAPVAFGLQAQGHIPTIRAMRADGKSWREIGDKIGWMAGTAEEHYLRWCERTVNAIAAKCHAEHDNPMAEHAGFAYEILGIIDGQLTR